MRGGNYYNKYATSNPIERHLVQSFLAAIKGLADKTKAKSLHEIGCGEGYLLSSLAVEGRELLGTDIADETVEEARCRYRDSHPNIRFEARNLYELEPVKYQAELVLCCEVLEHLADPDRALDVLASIARPYLIVSVPREPIWRLLNVMRWRYLDRLGDTPGHINHWSKHGIVEFLSRRFRILEVLTPLPWTAILCRVTEP